MALTRGQSDVLITIALLGIAGYYFTSRARALKRQFADGGQSLASRLQRNPGDAVETGLLAYELGLRPSSFLSGFGEPTTAINPANMPHKPVDVDGYHGRSRLFAGAVALTLGALTIPFTVSPWLIGKFAPNLGYGTRVLVSIGFVFLLQKIRSENAKRRRAKLRAQYQPA